MSERDRPSSLRMLSVALVIYMAMVAALCLVHHQVARRHMIQDIDERLAMAAHSLKFLLPDGFHDRATGPEAIDDTQDRRNIERLSRYAAETGLEFVYSLVLDDRGRLIIVSTSATEEEKRKGEEVRYYTPYEEADSAFEQALRSGKPHWHTHEDRWGVFRAALVPEVSPGGRPYLACAELSLADFQTAMQRNAWRSLALGLGFVLASAPVFLIYGRSRREIMRSEKIYRTVVENSFDGINIAERDEEAGIRRLLFCNQRFVEMSGYSREELFDCPNLNDLVVGHSKRPKGEMPRHGVSSWKRPDGRENYYEWHAVPVRIDGRECLVGVDHDITMERQTQEELIRTEKMHRVIIDNAFDGINVCELHKKTHKRRLISCNDRYVELSGYTREELMAMDDLNAVSVYHYHSPKMEPAEGDASMGVQKVWRCHGVASWKRPDGRENYYQWHATMLELGEVVRIVGADRDITEQRRTLRRLEDSERLHRSVVENAFDGINVAWTDAATGKRKLLMCNERYVEMSGYSRKELMDAENLDDLYRAIEPAETVKSRPGCIVQHGVNAWLRPDGRENYYEWTASFIDEEGGTRVIGADRDITDRVLADKAQRELEDKVRHTQKLESLGVLAGGIAHDFNNLLIGILGNADLAGQELDQGSEARPYLTSIETAAKRAADLCRQMLAYSGKGRFVIEAHDISELVREMGQLLEVSASKRTKIHYELADDLPPVEGDATQLRQVVMNLITNAAEAIGEQEGTITIITQAAYCDAEYLASTYLNESLAEGRYVSLQVSDTGCGMDTETLDRIFEPFYTTKFTGRGLGMAAVQGIVRGHQGAIKVYSEPGKGTTFKILLPAGQGQAPTPQDDAPEPGQAPWRATGKALLVDDEPMVRNVAGNMLRKLGFEVLMAADGLEGVEVFREHADEISLVLLDMTMPRMDGEGAFRRIRAIRPDAPVVLSSGYSVHDVAIRFRGKGLAGFVQKPYQSRLLRKIAERVLAGHDAWDIEELS